MKSVNPRYRARWATTFGLVLLAALAVAFLQARPLMASVSTTTGQAVATPTAADAMDHAAHGASPADAAGGQMQIENMPDMESMADMDHTADMNHSAEAEHTSGAEHTADMDHTAAMDHTADTEHTADADAHTLHDASTTASDHTDTHDQESNAHGHGAEATPIAASTRGLVLGGFGAVNGLVIVVAALFKTKTARTAKARRVNRPDTTPRGVSE